MVVLIEETMVSKLGYEMPQSESLNGWYDTDWNWFGMSELVRVCRRGTS